MRFVANILFLPFVVLFMVIGAIKGALSVKYLKYIPVIIQKQAEAQTSLGTAISELKFPQVLAYAKQNGTILNQDQISFEFITKIADITYKVRITRAPDNSNCAIFRSKKTSVGDMSGYFEADRFTRPDLLREADIIRQARLASMLGDPLPTSKESESI